MKKLVWVMMPLLVIALSVPAIPVNLESQGILKPCKDPKVVDRTTVGDLTVTTYDDGSVEISMEPNKDIDNMKVHVYEMVWVEYGPGNWKHKKGKEVIGWTFKGATGGKVKISDMINSGDELDVSYDLETSDGLRCLGDITCQVP